MTTEDPYVAKIHDLAADLVRLVGQHCPDLPTAFGFGIDEIVRLDGGGMIVVFSGRTADRLSQYEGNVTYIPGQGWAGEWSWTVGGAE